MNTNIYTYPMAFDRDRGRFIESQVTAELGRRHYGLDMCVFLG